MAVEYRNSWSLHSKGGETTEGSSIASNEVTVGVSTALSSYVSVTHDTY